MTTSSHDDARGLSVLPPGPALVTCRRRVVGGRCGIVLRPGWVRGYLAHTVKPASPHYPVPFKVGEIEPAPEPTGGRRYMDKLAALRNEAES